MEDHTDFQVASVNPFLYRGYYYDWEIGMYYLQSRYYDPTIGRFINADDTEYLGCSETVLGYNLLSYCENNCINMFDSTGTICSFFSKVITRFQKVKRRLLNNWFANQMASLKGKKRKNFVSVLHLTMIGTAVVFGRSRINVQKKVVRFNVPLYNQGELYLCWAYCQIMVEAFYKKKKWSQSEADTKAKALAIKVNGKANWNHGAWPTNLGKSVNINNIEELYVTLCIGGPLYGYYSSSTGAHLIVVTGVDLKKKVVYTNNPWGVKGTQTFNQFKKGVAKTFSQSGKGLVFDCVYLIN